jgi:hypothetical protein
MPISAQVFLFFNFLILFVKTLAQDTNKIVRYENMF